MRPGDIAQPRVTRRRPAAVFPSRWPLSESRESRHAGTTTESKRMRRPKRHAQRLRQSTMEQRLGRQFGSIQAAACADVLPVVMVSQPSARPVVPVTQRSGKWPQINPIALSCVLETRTLCRIGCWPVNATSSATTRLSTRERQ